MPETIKVPGATQLLLVAADDQVGVFLVLAAYSAFVVSGLDLNSEMTYAAQIPQHYHDTATTVSARVVVGQCRHGGGTERALHSRDDLRALIFQFGGQVS